MKLYLVHCGFYDPVKKMHVDGLQEVQVVDGFRIEPREDAALERKNIVISSRHRDLAPKSTTGA